MHPQRAPTSLCSPENAQCNGRTFPIPEDGYWSDRSDVKWAGVILKCAHPNACTGDEDEVCWTPANYTAEACSADLVCAKGGSGPVCGSCTTVDEVRYAYDESRGRCQSCEKLLSTGELWVLFR